MSCAILFELYPCARVLLVRTRLTGYSSNASVSLFPNEKTLCLEASCPVRSSCVGLYLCSTWSVRFIRPQSLSVSLHLSLSCGVSTCPSPSRVSAVCNFHIHVRCIYRIGKRARENEMPRLSAQTIKGVHLRLFPYYQDDVCLIVTDFWMRYTTNRHGNREQHRTEYPLHVEESGGFK